MLNFMIAGRDTTAVTLSWFFYLLCKNPDVEEKLLQEIHDLVKENKCGSMIESISKFSQSLTYAVLDKMHYLHAALSETLRLYPAVPLVRNIMFFFKHFLFHYFFSSTCLYFPIFINV